MDYKLIMLDLDNQVLIERTRDTSHNGIRNDMITDLIECLDFVESAPEGPTRANHLVRISLDGREVAMPILALSAIVRINNDLMDMLTGKLPIMNQYEYVGVLADGYTS